jgi:hypothetical protein
MATTFGNTVEVESQEQYEKLTEMATSLRGWWDPMAGIGQVTFKTNQQAQEARRAL